MNRAIEIIRQVAKIDKLGGPDSFFGYKEVFEITLKEEHERFNEIGEGMYRFKGMNQYGNIVSMYPSFSVVFRCIDEYHFPIERFDELKNWYRNRSIDCATLEAYIEWALKDQSKTRPELQKYIEEYERSNNPVQEV